MTVPLHILIIEDNPVDAELMTLQLRRDGFHFDWQRVETETAYLLALEQPPDLIVSDWSLPRFSGLQALQLVTERGLDIPFIIISGSIGEEAAVDALRNGAADYVWKDRPARLGPAVRRAFADKHARDERLRAEIALRESEAKLRIAQQIGRIGNWEYDVSDQTITWSNQTYVLYERDPQTGPPSAEQEAAYYTTEQAHALHEYARLAIATGQDFVYDLHVQLPSGKHVSFAARMQPMTDAQGRVIRLFGTVQDMTERTQAEAALRASEQHYQALAESAPVGIFRTTADGLTTYVNPRWCAIAGISVDAALGNGWLAAVHPDDCAHLSATWQAAIQTQTTSWADYRFLHADGRMTWVIGQAIPEKDEHGRLLSYVGTITDITARTQAEEALRASEAQLAGIIGSAMDAIISVNAAQHIFLFNPAAEHMFQCLASDAVGQSINRFIPARYQTALQGSMTQFGRTGITNRVMGHHDSMTGLRWNGEEFPIEASISHITTNGQQVYTVILRDITVRKLAEAALTHERNLLRTLIDNLPDAIYIKDRDGRFLLKNHADASTMGAASPDETIGKNDFDYYPPELAAQYQADDHAVLHSGQTIISREEPIVDVTGRTGWVSTTKVPLHDHQGRIIGLVGIGHDITARKHAEATLQESERFARATVDALSAEIAILDETGTIIAVNRAWRTFSAANALPGADAYNPIGVNYLSICAHAHGPDADEAAAVNVGIQAVMRGEQEAFSYEYPCHAPDEQRWFMVRVTRFPGAGALRLVVAHENITARKLTERALQEERTLLEQHVEARTAELRIANAELTRAAQLKDEFLASMSHELRTPLTAVLGIAEVLQDGVYGPLSERQRTALQRIEESGQHLLELINDILDVAKVSAGKLVLEVDLVETEALCQSSLRLVREAALKKQLAVTLTIDPAVTFLAADARRLKQMLVNLLSNAVKFTPANGAIGLDVVGDPMQHTVELTVWDTGIGIAPDDLGRLFQPFVQIDSRLARQYTGTGLGLTLVDRMAKLHGGRVRLTSERGTGSRFTIALPWQGARAPSTAHAMPPPPAPTETVGARNRPIILIAEDNATTLTTMTEYLESKGYQIVVARTGAEAVLQARATQPALILMDIQMPGMDGLEATQHIRAQRDLPTMPIIALTALAMPGDRERCLAAGADDYLSKPINLKALAATIDEQLRRTINQLRSVE